MTKRIVTRIGNIFCVEISNEYKCYFQYVAIDKIMLNSSTIRVFKKRYDIEENPKIEDIISDEVDFCAHTILRVGIEVGAWYKVGTSSIVGEMTDVKFREDGCPTWYIWHIGGSKTYIPDEDLPKYHNYNPGSIFSYKTVLHRIKHGNYPQGVINFHGY